MVNVNAPNWPTNLIGYDALRAYGSPSYYVQRLLSRDRGDLVVHSQFQGPSPSLATLVSRDTRDGALYLTVVNAGGSLQLMHVQVDGGGAVAPAGTATTLSGDPSAQNSDRGGASHHRGERAGVVVHLPVSRPLGDRSPALDPGRPGAARGAGATGERGDHVGRDGAARRDRTGGRGRDGGAPS
jgi:hypothetical protein